MDIPLEEWQLVRENILGGRSVEELDVEELSEAWKLLANEFGWSQIKFSAVFQLNTTQFGKMLNHGRRYVKGMDAIKNVLGSETPPKIDNSSQNQPRESSGSELSLNRRDTLASDWVQLASANNWTLPRFCIAYEISIEGFKNWVHGRGKSARQWREAVEDALQNDTCVCDNQRCELCDARIGRSFIRSLNRASLTYQNSQNIEWKEICDLIIEISPNIIVLIDADQASHVVSQFRRLQPNPDEIKVISFMSTAQRQSRHLSGTGNVWHESVPVHTHLKNSVDTVMIMFLTRLDAFMREDVSQIFIVTNDAFGQTLQSSIGQRQVHVLDPTENNNIAVSIWELTGNSPSLYRGHMADILYRTK